MMERKERLPRSPAFRAIYQATEQVCLLLLWEITDKPVCCFRKEKSRAREKEIRKKEEEKAQFDGRLSLWSSVWSVAF